MSELVEYNVLYDACRLLGLEVQLFKANKRLGMAVTQDGEFVWRRILRDGETLEDAASMAIDHLRRRGVHVT